MNVEGVGSMPLTIGVDGAKIWIAWIMTFDMSESDQMCCGVGNKRISTGQCIGNYIVFPFFVLDGVGEGFNKSDPTSMSTAQLTLASQVLQRLVVRMDYKFLRPQVVLPCFQLPYYRIELFIIGGVVENSSTEFLAVVGNSSAILNQYGSHSLPRSITFYFKGFIEVWEG